MTFFSPSGYEIRKNYKHADCISYLPFDSPGNAKRFLKIVNPTLAIFVKYEFWHFYLKSLKNQQIPTALISSVFRKSQPFFKWYGGFFKNMLKSFTYIFTQDENSEQLLNKIGIENSIIAGDTRVDRVISIAKNSKSLPLIQQFCEGHQVLICGSTWSPDEAILANFINNQLPENWKIIIAPHHIEEAHIREIENRIVLPKITYSNLLAHKTFNHKILIINNIGILSSIYQYGKIAYIGGGFGDGIHNTLEPIAFGLPVVFGPKYRKFTEANALVANGGGFSIKNKDEFGLVFEKLAAPEKWEIASEKAKSYLKMNEGATEKIFKEILQ